MKFTSFTTSEISTLTCQISVKFFKKKERNEIMGKFEAKYYGFSNWLDENPLKISYNASTSA